MNKAIVLATLTAPALAACYPMEQAPLVYASKATVGVGVQAGTTDNPGLELILGYKASDVALVPVAVAKHCGATSNCTDPIYAMSVVRGGKQDVSSNGAIEIDLNGARLERGTAVAEAKALQSRRAELAARQLAVKRRDELKRELSKVPDFSGDEEESITQNRESLQAKIAKLDVPEDVTEADIQAQLNDVDQQLSNKTAAVEQLDRQISNLTANLRNDISGNRDDAFSVYGTFGGGGQGDAQKGAINGDKVFATGIAAQNLSEFKGVIDCLGGIKKLADSIGDATARNKYISETSGMCVKK
ncbi:MAG: hypothetical protein CVT78_10495 [Alphaproteobacteria bacterium HGW-Alphaproteobacteria-17]|uniref:hypothetical protein n=1 Tax=Sphingopyxis solisilvae TaxID=1886788 RepID=UPI000CA81438|nr:MAG: hypothetical protein CVT78_10495 [Alphaproteobacteria bacterium HGW-Alphaproteobacteria-17]